MDQRFVQPIGRRAGFKRGRWGAGVAATGWRTGVGAAGARVRPGVRIERARLGLFAARGAAARNVVGAGLSADDGVEFGQRLDLLGDHAAHRGGAGAGLLGEIENRTLQLVAGRLEFLTELGSGGAHGVGGVGKAARGLGIAALDLGQHIGLGLAQSRAGAFTFAGGKIAEGVIWPVTLSEVAAKRLPRLARGDERRSVWLTVSASLAKQPRSSPRWAVNPSASAASAVR